MQFTWIVQWIVQAAQVKACAFYVQRAISNIIALTIILASPVLKIAHFAILATQILIINTLTIQYLTIWILTFHPMFWIMIFQYSAHNVMRMPCWHHLINVKRVILLFLIVLHVSTIAAQHARTINILISTLILVKFAIFQIVLFVPTLHMSPFVLNALLDFIFWIIHVFHVLKIVFFVNLIMFYNFGVSNAIIVGF